MYKFTPSAGGKVGNVDFHTWDPDYTVMSLLILHHMAKVSFLPFNFIYFWNISIFQDLLFIVLKMCLFYLTCNCTTYTDIYIGRLVILNI